MYYQSTSMCSNVPFNETLLCIVSIHFCKCTFNLYTVLPVCRPMNVHAYMYTCTCRHARLLIQALTHLYAHEYQKAVVFCCIVSL